MVHVLLNEKRGMYIKTSAAHATNPAIRAFAEDS
jgi:hypothetical protein